MLVEFLGRVQTQEMDGLYYIWYIFFSLSLSLSLFVFESFYIFLMIDGLLQRVACESDGKITSKIVSGGGSG